MHTIVEQHEQSGVSWVRATRASAAAVRSCVPVYLGYEERSTVAMRRLEVPHPNVTVIINLGAPLKVHAPALHAPGAIYTSFAAGLFDTVAVTENTGDSAGIELNVTPLGMWQLLGTPMSDLTNSVVSLDALLGAAADACVDQLKNLASWDARFDLLDTLLTRRLLRRPAPRSEIQWAWHRLCTAPQTGSVAEIARDLRWSRRRLTAEFRQHVGIPAKALSRIVRFDRAVRRVRAGGQVRWAALALECGYADQAHLTREFREFSGLAPTEFVRQQTPSGLAVL